MAPPSAFHGVLTALVTPMTSSGEVDLDAFDRVNRELRAMLAEPALNQSARKGSLQKAMDVLCADTHRTKVILDLSDCEELSDLTPLGALEHLQNLNQLTLNLCNCRQLSDLTPLSALAHLQNLNELTLILHSCDQLSDVTALGQLAAARVGRRRVLLRSARGKRGRCCSARDVRLDPGRKTGLNR